MWDLSEFCPGVPWKGLQNIDPETDPNMTPGSVPSGPTINTNIQDVNRYLLRDRSGGTEALRISLKLKKSFLNCDGGALGRHTTKMNHPEA